jgi:hypothetical protein
MFIFNTTFSVKETMVDEWNTWLRNTYMLSISELMVTTNMEVFEVMIANEEDSNRTFSVQCRCESPEDLNILHQHSTQLLTLLSTRFGENCLYFSSILREFNA